MRAYYSQADWLKRCIFLAHLPPDEAAGAVLELSTDYSVSKSSSVKVVSIERARDMPVGVRPSPVLSPELFMVKGRVSITRGSRPPIPDWQLDGSHIVHAVRGLPDHKHFWLRYAYTKRCNWEQESGIASYLWSVFVDRGSVVYTRKREARLKALVYLVLQDFKRYCNTGTHLYSAKKIYELLQVSRSGWEKGYLPKVTLMREILESVDASALRSIEPVICPEFFESSKIKTLKH